ncbi:MAG: hypothetical protein ACE5GD_05375 [Candidatus Geothermarchaeales archaeon]
MDLKQIIDSVFIKQKSGKIAKERLSCSGCGYTWVEMVGHIIGKGEGTEDLHLRLGPNIRDECLRCETNTITCEKCGSHNIYITVSDETPLERFSFKGITIVSRQF